jgi:3-oxoacyl-[acyl-carrier-protein] synthase II
MDRKEARRADRFTQFAFVAAQEALAQARYDIDRANGQNTAVVVGTAIGGVTTLMEEYNTLLAKGPGRVSPFLVPMMLPDMASGQLSIRLGAKGVNYCLVSACAVAPTASAKQPLIRRGDVDVAIAGHQAAITPIIVAGFSPRAPSRAITARSTPPGPSTSSATDSPSPRAPASSSSSQKTTRPSAARRYLPSWRATLPPATPST